MRKRHRNAQRRRRRRGRLLIPIHGKAREGKREREKRGWWRKKSGEWEKTGGITLKESIQRRGRTVPSALDIPSFLLPGCHTRLDSEGPTPRPPQTPWGNRYV